MKKGSANQNMKWLKNQQTSSMYQQTTCQVKTDIPDPDSDIDLDSAIDNSVAYDGTPITDHDREIIKELSKTKYFSNKKNN